MMTKRPENDISRMALEWNPQGSQGKGRLKITWKTSKWKNRGMKLKWY